jgi:methyltransferase (TIGR00027 family)
MLQRITRIVKYYNWIVHKSIDVAALRAYYEIKGEDISQIMRQMQSSKSAMGVASLRAFETQKPEGVRVCNDPFARLFASSGIGYSISKWIVNAGIYDKIAPGGAGFVIVRERYVDDCLIASLTEGLDQVVLLGAGFDTRAFRIPGIEKTRVFDIDQPATQAAKLEKLKKAIDPLPPYVTFLPVDFNTQSLEERLPAAGYDERGKTLFIWQGVTYFLTKEGVDSTLKFIASHSGRGSSVIFDYMYNEILRDTSRADVKNLRRAAQLTGEEYLFGIDRGQIEPFLTQRGFRDVCSVTLEELKQRYFTGPNAGRLVAKGVEIASATVDR